MNEPQPSTRSNFNSQYPGGPNSQAPPQMSQQPPMSGYPNYVDSAQPYHASNMPPPPPEMMQNQESRPTHSMDSQSPPTTGDGLPGPSPPPRRGVMDFITQFFPAPKAGGEGSLFNMPSWLTRLPCFATKYILLTITFILLLIACIVILMYLTLSHDEGCGDRCKAVGDPGLYISAFGDAKVWSGDSNNTCENWKSTDVMFAAINYYQFGLYQELKWSPVCNKCVRVSGPRGIVQAKITDICEDCTYGSIMLSEPAFRMIADEGIDNVPVTWGPC